MRPEAERKLREGFQRRVDEQSSRYAAQLAHARQEANRFECGEVAGVFGAQAGGEVPRRTYVVAFLPIAAIPVLIVIAASGIPATVPLLMAFPFIAGAWIGVSFWRGRTPKRPVWLYAFTEGFLLLDDAQGPATPVRWSEVTEIGQVWTNSYRPGDEDPTPVLSAYHLRLADGRTATISRDFKNVQDPYREMGQLFRTLAPGTIGKTMPRFFTIDEILATYARAPGRGT